MSRINALRGPAIGLVTVVLVMLAYQLATSMARNPYFPTLGQTASAFVATWSGNGLDDIKSSLGNLFRGYLPGALFGIVAGGVLGRMRILQNLVGPTLYFIMVIPPVAMLPIFMSVLGIGAPMQIGIIFFACATNVLIITANAVGSVDKSLLDVARVYRLKPLQRAFAVYYPAATLPILAAAKVSLGAAVLIMVASEMVGASKGIGVVTLTAQQSYSFDVMWAGIWLVAGIGLVLNMLFALVQRLIINHLKIEQDA